jgi:Do/DeqQ family serine protease
MSSVLHRTRDDEAYPLCEGILARFSRNVGSEITLEPRHNSFVIQATDMKTNKFFVPLVGAVAFGFFIGACTRMVPPQQAGNSDVGLGSAQAQTNTPIRNADDLARLSTTYADIARRVTPAVVNISTRQIIRGRVMRDPFGGFFGGGDGLLREPDQRQEGTGSGVIVDARGVIITNHHVIQNAESITVTMTDRQRFTAKLIGSDPPSDVAVLKIDAPQPLPVVPWADSDKAQVGDIVLAIGSPFNLASSVTQGILSAKARRDLGISAVEDFLQTDAAINPGNSGGALVDIQGRLVGINTAILSRTGGNQGIGLAIPARLARQISGQLLANGRVTRGWIGIVTEPVTDDMAQEIGLPQTQGVLVTGVLTEGPAAELAWARSGGNVILKVNDVTIDSPGQLRNLIADAAPGSQMRISVWQNGRTRTFNVTVGQRGPRTQGI